MHPWNEAADIAPRYFTSVFVSLGVFLFGYDQGVMSGIITYVQRHQSNPCFSLTKLVARSF